jgi:NhaA family Na+:H+ antiporter
MSPTEPDDGDLSGAGLRVPWAHSDRTVPRRVVRPLQEFLRASTSGGILLVAAAIVAVVWANSGAADTYERLWRTQLSIGFGDWSLAEDLRYWVNDGLMALFFLVVGLEIKRELLIGELRDLRAAVLPVIAAVAGMVVPALIYLAITAGGDGARGWGIAMPTDIAVTLGILALAARGAPAGLKAFVLTLALVDDIFTIVVIAFFYPTGVEIAPILLAAGIAVAMTLLDRIHVRATAVYVSLGVLMWLAMHAAGVEPALAGVVVGLMTPSVAFQRPRHVSEEAIHVADETVDEPDPPDADAQWWLRLAGLSREAVSPLARVEHVLLPWTTFLVLPLFALANAGVRLSASALSDAMISPVALGVAIGHVAGKILGIGVASWLVVRSGLGVLPEGTSLGQVFGVAAAAGVAFTVSFFVGDLAFSGRPDLIEQAKVGIFISAVIAGPLGYALLRLTARARPFS